MKTIDSCTYYSHKDNMKWEIEYQKEKAVISKKDISKKSLLDTKKKLVDKEVMSNLDIFFDKYDFESWNKASENKAKDIDLEDSITVVYQKEEYRLSANNHLTKEEKDIFKQLNRYFRNYFEQEINPIILSFHSFDGGGPEYHMETEVKGIFTWYSNREYLKKDHEILCGAGYNMIYKLYPLREGVATAILTGDSPICMKPPRRIEVKVEKDFSMEYEIKEIDIEKKR